jgi:hypothetical protein
MQDMAITSIYIGKEIFGRLSELTCMKKQYVLEAKYYFRIRIKNKPRNKAYLPNTPHSILYMFFFNTTKRGRSP